MRTEKFKMLFDFAPKSNVKAGDGLEDGNFPFYTSSSTLKKRIDKAQYFDEALIFGTGGSASVHFAGEPFATSTDCIVAITKNEDLKTKFVYYYLFGNIHLLERGFKGAGLKHITKKYIENLDIPVFPIETQNKIVAILDKASSLVTKREESISMLDELLRATFLDTFGDPLNNEKDWNVDTLESVTTKITDGKHGDCENEYNSGYYFISAKDLVNGKIKYEGAREITKKDFDETHKRTRLAFADVLIGNTGASIGKIAIVDDAKMANKTTFQKSIAIVTVDNIRISPKFFRAYLQLNRTHLERISSGSGQKNLLLSQLRSLSIILPPINLQNDFVKIIENVEQQIDVIKGSLIELNNLYNSLCQKAFNGQLNFNVDFEMDSLIQKIDLKNKDFEEYSATDNDRTEPWPVEIIKDLKKSIQVKTNSGVDRSSFDTKTTIGKSIGIPFTEMNGNIIFKHVFAKKIKGFRFDEFEEFVKKEGFTYDYLQLKDFIFNKLENNEIVQFYSNKEWREANYNKDTSPFQDDFAGDGKIYLVPSKIKK